MKDRILRVLEKSPADYTEIRLERRQWTQVSYQNEDLEHLESSNDAGGMVRALVRGGWGIAVFNQLDELEHYVEEAARIATAVSREVLEPVELAPLPPLQDDLPAAMEQDFRAVSLRRKQALLAEYNNILRSNPGRLVMTGATYADLFREVTFANSQGTYLREERPDVTVRFMATARCGQDIQTAFDSDGRSAGFEAALSREAIPEEVARRAEALLEAKPAQGGVYTVVLDPLLAGVFIHEAFGHLCEADFLSKNNRLREVLGPGRRFGPPDLNVIDDGDRPGQRGNTRYDDEGTPRRRVHLIRNGVLEGFLHNRETAKRMNAQPTGNARAVSYRFEPIVRMRHTYIDQGTVPFSEMIAGISQGIYACSAFGGQTELEQFTFSAGYAYEIKDGKIGEMLRDVVLTGNIFETLTRIDAIGDDLQLLGSAGGCGKGGQSGLPVTVGAPHIRIRELTLGGR
ncbi:MAG: TldD/PmbA family protein [bacterium]